MLTERQQQILAEIVEAKVKVFPDTARWDVQALAAHGLIRTRPDWLTPQESESGQWEQQHVAELIEGAPTERFTYWPFVAEEEDGSARQS